MPVATPPGFKIGSAEPVDAFAAFERRSLLAPSFRWEDVYQQEHAAGFAVAGVAQADVLALFQEQVRKSLASGGTLADFAKVVKPALVAKGWWGDIEVTNPATGESRITRFDDARLQLIYDVNLRQSYAAGRWARIERTKASKPLVMYRTMRDERVRHSHAQWDGLALPVDHPFWQTHYPPNGWRCRCTAFAVSERDLAAYTADGDTIKRDAPPIQYTEFVNRGTGEVSKVPEGIDPGFAYNPGQVRPQHLADLQRSTLDAADPAVAQQLVAQQLRGQNFARFVDGPLRGEAMPVAMLPPAGAAAIGARGRATVLPAEVATRQAAEGGSAGVADYQAAQLVIDAGQRHPDGPGADVYVLAQDGLVLVLRLVRGPDGAPVLDALRRLTPSQAQADPLLKRLGVV